MMNYDEVNTKQVNLQDRSCQYDKPPVMSMIESQPKGYTEHILPKNNTLHIPQPKVEVITKILKLLLCQNVASSKNTHIYRIIDDFVQSFTPMSTLKVL